MKFELHTTDGEVINFSAPTIEAGAEEARGHVLGNIAWIDYVVANPGTHRATIVDVEHKA